MGTIYCGNPVKGQIRPPGSPEIKGSFRVTARFGQVDAAHPTPHLGVDIGNLKCDDPILAMADGEVSFIQRSNGNPRVANIVRIQHDGPEDIESGYAHLATIAAGIDLRKRVSRGQVIGTLGRTGATACHLHMGMKVNRQEVDGWPMLDQNRVTLLQGDVPEPVHNRRGHVLLDHTRFRSTPFIVPENVLQEFGQGTEIDPDFVVEGGPANGSVKWYAAWVLTPRGREFGYIHVSTVGPLAPIEVVEAPIL